MPSSELVFLQSRLACEAQSAGSKMFSIQTHTKEKGHVPGLSPRALERAMTEVIALMSDGTVKVILHDVRTYLAGKCFHVVVVKESSIDRLTLDPPLFHSEWTICITD